MLIAIAVAALRLHDRIEADAGIGEHPAYGRGRAGFIGDAAHGHLGLIPVERHTAHLGCAGAGWGWVEMQLPLAQLKALGCGLQGFAALVTGHQAAHFHFAGGDQAQVDAALGQGVEQAGRHAGAPHDPGAGDAQLGHAAFSADRGALGAGAHGRQHFAAHQLGPIQLRLGHGEGDVVGEAAVVAAAGGVGFVGGLHDQIHVQPCG